MGPTTLTEPINIRRTTSWFWLVLAALVLCVANGRNTIPLAAWLAPTLLLRFLRGGRWWRMAAAFPFAAACFAFQFRGMVPAPQPMLAMAWLGYGACLLLPFIVDRLLAHRVHGFLSTLVFPCAAMSFDYLLSLLPYGSWGSPAYTQYGNLPLMQLASVTGIYGITFLIAWFAATLAWAWEQQFDWPAIRRGVLIYAAAFVAAFAFGSFRLMFEPSAPTVRVASLSRDTNRFPNGGDLGRHSGRGPLTADEVREASERSRLLAEDLLRRAAREADAGAKIVFWAETNSYVLPGDEPWLMTRAGELAREKRIYLGLGNAVWHAGERRPLENTFVLFGPEGSMKWRYLKAHPVPGGEAAISIPASGLVPFADTPFGRLSCVICFDADSVQLLHQAGAGAADLELIPSNDWRAIDPWHTQMAVFRAVEQGVNAIRHTSNGLSVAVDYQGRVRASMDHYQTAGDRTLVAEVPTRGVRTIYSRAGDLFSWIAIAGLLALGIAGRRG